MRKPVNAKGGNERPNVAKAILGAENVIGFFVVHAANIGALIHKSITISPIVANRCNATDKNSAHAPNRDPHNVKS